MKSNKEIILSYIYELSNKNENFEGVTTQNLADILHIQRSNISAVLNELVNENILEKSIGRPVLYNLKSENKDSETASCFNKYIGHKGSLKNAVQLAKAAILYPEISMGSLIIGERGVGKVLLTSLMFKYAKEKKLLLIMLLL